MKRMIAGVALAAATVLSVPAPAHADTWRSVPLPFFWPQAPLTDISAAAAGNVWFTGGQGRFCIQWVDFNCLIKSDGNPVARRWTGSEWAEYPLFGYSGNGALTTVETSPSGDVWVDGGYPGEADYLGRFVGWAFEKVTEPAGADVELVGAGPAGAWVRAQVNGAWVLHRRTGDTWTQTSLPSTFGYVQDVATRTADDAWAVGSGATGQPVLAAAHWDGTSWTNVPVPSQGVPAGRSLSKVAVASANNVWAMGTYNLARWNGSTWSVSGPPLGLAALNDLTVDGNGTPWLVGTTNSTTYTPRRLYRYVGGAWEEVPIPVVSDVYYVTSVPGTNTIWGIGVDATGYVVFTNS